MSYLKNVGKSIGYAIPAIIEDKFKDLGQLSKMVANPKEFKTLFKDSVKDMLNDTSSDMNSEIVGPIKKMYGRASKAAKTGNYFRSEKERTASAFEAFGGDFNMDFDFNTDSLESSIDDSTDATYENTNAIYETGVMQVATSTRAAKSITSELSRLSSLTYELSKLQTELTRTQISEAGRYYASSLGFLGEMTESMSALKNEMVALRMVSAPPDIFKGPNAQKYYEVLTASNFNMRSYFNYLGKKAKDSSAYSMLSMAGMMGSMMDPVEEAVKAMFSPITNSKFGKRMQSLNKAIGNMPLFMLRSLASKDYGDSFFGKRTSELFKFLNVDYLDTDKRVNMKTDIRTVPWDAESKDALVLIIPNLLSKILSAVKKEDWEREGSVWDPNVNKFRKTGDLKDEMSKKLLDSVGFNSFSQIDFIKEMMDSQEYTGTTTEEKDKQKKLFQMRLYGIGHKGLKAGAGNLDLDKALSTSGLFDAEDTKLAELMRDRVKSKTGLDGFNDKVNLGGAIEEMGDNITKTITDMMSSTNRDFATQYRGLGPDDLYKLLDNRNHNIDYDKLKNSNNGGNGGDNNNNGGGNPPVNDSFFDKMRKLIDGSYLFTKLNGFLDTISEKTSKFIFGDDTFVGPQKSFFEKLKDGIKDKLDKFSEVFKETFKPLKDYFIQTLIPNLSNAFQGIKKYLVDDIYKGIMGGHTLTGQGGIITNIKESIKGKFNKAKEYLMGTKDDGGNETSEGAFKKIYKSLGFESIFNKFKDGVRSLGDVLKENTEKLAKFFNKHLFEDGGLLKGLGDKISTFFKDTTDSIKKDILNPLKEFLIGDDGILTKAKENIKQNILSPIRDFFIDKDNGIFNDAFKLKFRNTFIQPLEDFFLGKGDNKQNIFKRLMGRLNKDMFFGKEKKYNKNGIQATAGGMFGDSNSFLYKFLFGTSSVDAAGKVNKNTKGLIDNISEKGAGKYLIEKLSETIFKPFSNYLMGDENKPGILRKFATYLDTNIANPIKSFLFGDDEKEGALGKFRNSFNTFLFGDGTDKRKGVIGDYLKPATDFIKVQLLDPFLDTMKNQWTDMKTFFKEGVLEPLITSFDGLGTSIGIKITNLAKEGKGLFVDAFKSTLQVANESIGNMLSSSSKTLTDMMKENVLDPIKSTLDKLRTGMWAVLKGFIKIPINAFSAVTDKIKISNLMKGEGGHLSEAQQARLLEVHNKTAKDKDKKESWGEQKKYFGDNGEEIKKGGIFSSFMDKLHDNRKNREDNANRDSIGKKVTDLNYSEEHKESQKNKQKTLKSVTDSAKIDVTSQNNSFEDIKNLSENSDKSTQSLSELLDVFKNPIPEITTSIKDIKDNVIKYIREHSLTNINDNKAKKDNPSSENKEGDKKNNELKESSKEIKSTNGLLTDIRDGVDTMIYVLRQGLHVGGEGGSNIRGGKNSGGSLGRVLEGLILNPLGMIKSVFEGGFKAITDSIGSVFKVVTEPLIQVTKSIGEGVRSFFKLIGKVGGVVEGLSNLGGKLLTSLGNLIGDVSQGIGTLLKDSAEIFGGIAKDLGSVLSTVVTSTMTVIEGVSEALKPLTEFVFKGIGTILGMITVGVTQSAKVAKAVMKSAGGFLGDVFGIKFGDQTGKMVKAVSIDGGMLTGISDVVKVFVVGGNLDGISNKVNSGGMDTSKLSSDSKSGESLKDVVNKTKVDLTRPDDYKKRKDSKTGGIKESLVNMRDNVTAKLKDLREKMMLSNSSKTVEHLSEIRKDGKGLFGMLMMAIPAIVTGLGSLLTFLGLGSVGTLLGKGLSKIKGFVKPGSVKTPSISSGGMDTSRLSASGARPGITEGVKDTAKVSKGFSKLKALKSLGLGLALEGVNYSAEKNMKAGATKDFITGGTDIASSALFGATLGMLVPVIGPPLGAIAGGLFGVMTNLDKISNVSKATWHFFAGNGAEYDSEGNVVKEGSNGVFDKLFGNDLKLDEKGNVLEKQEDSFNLSDWWFGTSERKLDDGQVFREAKKGMWNSIKELGNSIGSAISTIFDDMITDFPLFLDNALGAIGFGFTNMFDTIGSWASSLGDFVKSLVPDWFSDWLDQSNNRTVEGVANKLYRVDTDAVNKNLLMSKKDRISELTNTEWFGKDTVNTSAFKKMDITDAKALLEYQKANGNLDDESVTRLQDFISSSTKAPIKRAKGGIVLGKGTETSDSIDAKLSNKEYVLNANAVKMLGKDTLDKINNLGLAAKDSAVDSGISGGLVAAKKYLNKFWKASPKGGLGSLAAAGVNYGADNFMDDSLSRDILTTGSSIAGSALTGSVIGPEGTVAGLGYGIYDNRKNIAKIGSKAYNKMISNIFPWLSDKTGKLINFTSEKIFPWLSDKTGKLINFTSEKIFPWLSETASSIGKSISNGVSSVWNGAKNIGQSIITGAKEAYQGAVDYTSQNIIPGAVDKYNSITKVGGSTKAMMSNVLNAFKKAGFSDKQALALSAEVGRENGYNEKNVFGSHTDAANGVRNTGFFSWQGNRSKKLMERLASKGLVDKSGNMMHSQEALNEMALFAKDEMSSGQYKGLGDFMNNKDINPDDAAKKLGKGYIKWAYGQDRLRSGKSFDWRTHDKKRAGYYGQLSQINGINGNISVGDNQFVSGGLQGLNNNQEYLGDDGKKGEGTTTAGVTNKISPSGNKIGGGTSGFSSGNPNSLDGVKFAHSDIHLNKVHPELYNRFGKLAAEYKAKFGKDLVLNSAWRSVEKQAALAKASGNSKMVAPPGRSMHNFGYALDVNKVGPGQNPMIPDDMLAKYGLYRPMMSKKLYEPWHIELNETKGVRSKISREGYVPSIGSGGSISSQPNLHDTVSNLGSDAIINNIGNIKIPNNSVDYNNISSNRPETDKNIAITNASTDVKGLVIKDAITEQTNSYNNMSEEGNGTKTNSQSNVSTSRIEALLETIARNTGETAKKDFTINSPENKDKKNINLFEGNNTRINPYASYTDNSKMKVMDKRLEQANIIARGQ